MDLKKIAAGASLIALSAGAQAEYSVDLGTQFLWEAGEYEFDSGDKLDIDESAYGLSGVVFFGSVDTSSSPIRESAFLSKQSSLGVKHSNSNFEVEDASNDIDRKRTEVTGRFVISGADLIILAGYGRDKGDLHTGMNSPKSEIRIKTLGFGGYINEQGAITASYTQYEWDRIKGESEKPKSESLLTLSFRQLISTGGRSNLATYFDLTRGNAERYDENGLAGGVTWYPNQKFGFGARLALAQGDGEYVYSGTEYERDMVSFGPHFTMDFSEHVGIFLDLKSGTQTIEDEDGDEDEYNFVQATTGLNVRF